MSTDVLESARAFARAGFPVFPCGQDKRPRLKWKEAATTDEATIRQWWRDWPDAMIGLPTGATSGLYVIDLDIDKETGEAIGEQTVDQLGLKAAIAGAPSVLTAGGGRHFYFCHPGDGWGNTARKIGAGIDTRGEGGYVIAPGSVNGAGVYQWTGPSIFERSPPDLPEAIRKTLNAPEKNHENAFNFDGGNASKWADAALAAELVRVVAAHQGERNDTLNRAAFSLGQIVGSGHLNRGRVETALMGVALGVGLDAGEASATIRSGLDAGESDPRGPKEDTGHKSQKTTGKAEYEAPDPAPWPAPDMSLIRSERRAPPLFPAEVFGPWNNWIAVAAECKGAAPDYVGHALLTVAGSLIGNTRWAAPQPGWSEPPILFSALIGDPSAGKSPAMDAVLDPVRELEAELAHDYADKLRKHEDAVAVAAVSESAWKEAVKAAVKKGREVPGRPAAAYAPDAPVRPRLSFSDATPEKVAEILEALWRSVLLRRDELSGWLGNMNKYSGGGDRAFWLEAYGGRSYTVERVKRPEPIIVDSLTIGILGTIQPDRLEAHRRTLEVSELEARLAAMEERLETRS